MADRPPRVYWLPNLDGVRQAVVAAKNQKAALARLGVSAHAFRAYGGRRTFSADLYRVALAEPVGRVWVAAIRPSPGVATEWVPRPGG